MPTEHRSEWLGLSVQEEFEAAAVEAKTITPEPEDEEKLELYAFYKQAIVGDVNTGDYFTL